MRLRFPYTTFFALVVFVLLDTSLAVAQNKCRMSKNSFAAMTNSSEPSSSEAPASFYEVLCEVLKKRKTSVEIICPPADPVAKRILEDYGAMFLATKKVKPPPVCIFTGDAAVAKFQDEADWVTENIEGADVDLQREAMKQLLKAREQALK